MNSIFPAFAKNNIPIVLASDNNYIPYLSVALTSLAENSSLSYNYDILIFSKDISIENQNIICGFFEHRENFSIRFIDVNLYIQDLNFQVTKYYSIEIYFRLLMPEILEAYPKAIYLDCDLVVLGNIAELWEIDIGDSFVGAVRDIGMVLHYYTKGKRYIPLEYFTECLAGVNPDNYFNSGVLVMNLDRFRQDTTLEEISQIIYKNKWNFPDQDVLNIVCRNNVYYLDPMWNTVPETTGNRKIENILSDVPREIADAYIAAREKPKIVHYAMNEKPWRHTLQLDFKLFDYFWKCAVKSIYIRKIVSEKRKTCSLAEMAFILKNYLNEEIKTVWGNEDIHYVSPNFYLGNFSSISAKLETASLTSESILIDGCTVLYGKEAEYTEFFFEVNGVLNPCEKFERNIEENFGGISTSKVVEFRGLIPFSDECDEYKIRLVCRVNDSYIIKSRINFGRFFPIDKKYKKQYYFNSGFKLFLSNNYVVVSRCGRKRLIKSEFNYLRALCKSKQKCDKKAVVSRILYWIFKIFSHKKIWLIADNFLADDNGIIFFKYLMSHSDSKIKPYFVMSQNSEAYKKVMNYKNVVFFGTKKYKLLLLLSTCSVSSVTDYRLIKPFDSHNDAYRDILHKRDFIFLQHGVITQDLSREHNKYCYNPSGFVTSAWPEYNSLIHGSYYYTEKEVWLTGLPRFDALYHDEQKYITIMPTWRAYLVISSPEGGKQPIKNFMNSSYFKFYNKLLHHQKLLNAADKYGYKLCYKPHPLMQACTKLFLKMEDNITILDENYRDIFAKSSLIISDYSSAIFDFLYLKKPIIYAHFDQEEFFSGKHCYDKGYLDYERDGFGEVEYDLEGTVDRIIEYMENGCQLKDKYRQRIDSFFAFNDQNNCQRVYEKIMELEQRNQ